MSSTAQSTDRTNPLPVLQLNSWAPAHEPVPILVGCAAVLVFLGLVHAWTENGWLTLGCAFCLAVSLWRLWLPIRFELDSRGIQQSVLGRRSFLSWSQFARFEVSPVGVLLTRDTGAHALDRWTGLYVPSPDRHLELVHLVETYMLIDQQSRFSSTAIIDAQERPEGVTL